ncbi:hypothetical protein ACWEQ8_10675 [Streptomyces noursei]
MADTEVGTITALGSGNRFTAAADSEMRFDGVLTVPAGRKIATNGIKYWYLGPTYPNSPVTATEVGRTSLGLGYQYAVVNTRPVGDKDEVTFHLRGDLGGDFDGNPCPNPDKKVPVKIQVTLDDGSTVTTEQDIDVVTGTSCPNATVPIKPVVQLPYSTGFGGTAPGYSESGFGYIADDGSVPKGIFFINVTNNRISQPTLSCSKTDHVYYQLVDDQGKPAKTTPDPVSLPVTANASFNPGANTVQLDAMDLSDEAPGYYKLLVWPQATNSDGSNGAVCSYDQTDVSQGFQVGSIFNKYEDLDPDTPDVPLVDPGIAAGVVAVGALGAAGVYLRRRRSGGQAA